MKNEKGFTLIEIIAVLVILGILAAVAIPRYFDMQTEAQNKALDGAMASLQSTATQDYANGLLKGTSNATTYTISNGYGDKDGVNLGDFKGQITASGGTVTLKITSGPTSWFNANSANATKTVNLF